MRLGVVVVVAAVACCAGCSNSPADAPKVQAAAQPSTGGSPTPAAAETGKRTEAYWDQCIEVNEQFVTDKAEVWFKEFRPAAVGGTCREAAKRLREIENTGVDPEVIDHINRVIRGFEQMGAIAETKGKESLWRDTAAATGFIIKVAMRTNPGAVADGGSLAMGIGASEEGGRSTREGQAETIGVANKLMHSEEHVIRHVRKTYGIDLRPW